MQLKRKILSSKQKIDRLGSTYTPKLSPFHPALHATLEENLRRPHKLDILLQSIPPNEDIQECHSWNPNDLSSRFSVKEDDKFTIVREYAYSFVGYRIRGKMGYSRGFHVWQLRSREVDTGAFEVGMATKDVDVESDELLGYDSESFGWSKVLNQCRHDFPEFAAWRTPVMLDGVVRGDEEDYFPISDNLYCILDMDEGYLSFATDDHYSGVAFRGLKGKTLYPIISAFGGCEITMKYLGGLNRKDDITRCSCVGCTNLVVSEYCKDCSGECVIEHEGTCRNDRSLSPHHPILHGSLEDNLRRPPKLDILLHSNPPNKNIQERNAWNPSDKSSNISVKNDDKFTFCRNGNTDLFARVRGKIGYSNGFHVWQLHTPNGSLSWLDVGVATENSQLDTGNPNGFDQESYGWHIFRSKCYHDSPRFAKWKFPVGLTRGASSKQFAVSDKLYCILDMDEGYLAFATDEQYLGVAFRGLKGKKLYPLVSSQLSCEVTMKYLGGLNPWAVPSSCLCKGCPRLIIGWDCKECSDKCEMDHEEAGDGGDWGITKDQSAC